MIRNKTLDQFNEGEKAMSEVTEINKQITEDNDKIEKVLEKLDGAILKVNNNIQEIQKYVLSNVNELKNATAQQALLKTSNNLNNTLLKVVKAHDDLIKSSQDPKIYTSLLVDPEEEEEETTPEEPVPNVEELEDVNPTKPDKGSA